MNGFETLIYEKDAGVAWVTLNRPEAHNAINMRMRDELWEAMHAVRDDPDARAGIFRGAGERAFSAGGDIIRVRGGPGNRGWKRERRPARVPARGWRRPRNVASRGSRGRDGQ